jgi:NADPH:quinone reductase-like Zn-dependent oxidoreductase
MMMYATVFERHGSDATLVWRELPTPVPAPDEVLIQLEWAAVNHLDIDIRNGVSGMAVGLPHILGTEGTGIISAMGSAVRDWHIGQRVGTYAFRTCRRCKNCLLGRQNMCMDIVTLGGQRAGAYAQYVLVRDDQLVEVPATVSLRDALASYKMTTVWEALVETAALQPNEVVLVTGAGGGVGLSAVLLAHRLGARVIAATGSDQKNATLLALGASHVVNYRSNDLVDVVRQLTQGAGVDVVLDVASGDGLRKVIAATRPGGRVAVVGAHAGERVEIDMLDLFRRHIAIHGCGRYTTKILKSVFQELANGMPPVPIHQAFALADAAKAHRVMESRDFLGRLLLYCGAGDALAIPSEAPMH